MSWCINKNAQGIPVSNPDCQDPQTAERHIWWCGLIQVILWLAWKFLPGEEMAMGKTKLFMATLGLLTTWLLVAVV